MGCRMERETGVFNSRCAMNAAHFMGIYVLEYRLRKLSLGFNSHCLSRPGSWPFCSNPSSCLVHVGIALVSEIVLNSSSAAFGRGVGGAGWRPLSA